MAGPPAEAHQGNEGEMYTTEAFYITNWLPETGCSAVLHPSCTWRNSIPALGLGLVETEEVVLDAWKQKGGEMHIIPI